MTDINIRKRQSFQMWNELYNFCRNNMDLDYNKTAFLLDFIHEQLDQYKVYGLEQKMLWSRESKDLLLKDVKVKK